MFAALLWGLLAASSLVIGAALGVWRNWSDALVGAVLGFGAGALVSSISFELAAEGFQRAGAVAVALGLAAGALAFFLADRGVARLNGRDRSSRAGWPLALGALLDGVPEQATLGIAIATTGSVSPALLVAIFVSNLPEAIGSASEMRKAGSRRRVVLGGWAAVTVLCAVATAGGFALKQATGPGFEGAVDGFAAGALLVMLVGSMIPDANDKFGDRAGLAAVLGFAMSAYLSLAG
ncbi:ZIP family metal transporter [Mycolicibacterium sediminis]|uniref:Membrane protein n=1 Tax=Mycolicibacterium sediminis TaxID=1286180 RepID=A0A7I7QZN2_9MYCO|nr:hypothetical protein [Mycolicibacterium sediminis]BBY31755.1 membrane protein [Mycolicibacterium sediminis]